MSAITPEFISLFLNMVAIEFPSITIGEDYLEGSQLDWDESIKTTRVTFLQLPWHLNSRGSWHGGVSFVINSLIDAGNIADICNKYLPESVKDVSLFGDHSYFRRD